jgi:site-specific DNA-methyltransferase (adenine-specific)
MRTYTVPYHEIKVSHSRIREELGNLEDLSQSILRFGQLQPIIVDENLELIDGFRRYSALGLIGASEALVIQRKDVDDLMYRELELEANIQRKDMTWIERVKAIAGIDEIRRRRDPSWGQTQTAILAGVTQAQVSQSVNLAKMLDVFPEIASAKSTNQALSWAKHKAATVVRTVEVNNNPEDYADIESCIQLGDTVDVIKTIPSESFHAVITDPPFGIGYNSRKANKAGVETAYADDEATYRRLLTMAPDIYRVLKPNGWLVWFFGMSWYQECVDTFEAAGFTVDPLPIVWNRSGGRSHTNRPDKYMARAYDVALHCHKGDPEMVVRGKPNVITIDPIETHERDLMVERPVELYAEIIERLTIPGEIVADLFVGSGSCPAAAAQLRRRYWGCEINPERRVVAVKKIRAYTPT